jgi:hypothetical protein
MGTILLIVIGVVFYGGFDSKAAQGMAWSKGGILTALRGANSLAFGQPLTRNRHIAPTMADVVAAQNGRREVPAASVDLPVIHGREHRKQSPAKTAPPMGNAVTTGTTPGW